MSAPLSVGIVGAGLMGRWHAHAARVAGARVVGVADPDRARAEALAKACGGARVMADARELFAAAPVPACVHVCTPLEGHASAVEVALTGGAGALVEKPLAADAATTEHLLEAARAAGVPLVPVHQLPFQDGVRRALAGLAHSGPLRHVDLRVVSAGGVGRDAAGLRALEGEILPHPLSLFDALLAPGGGGLSALEWRAWRSAPGELRVLGRTDGLDLQALVSFAGRPSEHSLALLGERGTWRVDLFHGFATHGPPGVSRARKIAAPFGRSLRTLGAASANLTRRALRREPAYPGLRPLVEAFHAAVRGEAPVPIPPESVLAVARTRDAILAELG